jgi:DNA-directed RNA polymerase specialized sigma24 family protein
MLDELDPAVLADADRLEDLRAIRAIVDDQRALEDRLRRAVAEAHANGRSWAEIARVLGVTKQSAHARFAEPATAEPAGRHRKAT